MIPGSPLRRAMVASLALHALAAVIAAPALGPSRSASSELVDIEIAPPVPLPEALPPEVARPPPPPVPDPARPDEPVPASTAPQPDPEAVTAIDAGVDARPDAAIDARPDAAVDARPDAAGLDAPLDAAPGDADLDAGVPERIAGEEADADRGDAGAEVATAASDAGRDDAGAEIATAASDADRGDAGPQVAIDEHAGSGSQAAIPAIVAAGPAAASAGSGSASNAGSAADTAAGALDTTALAQALAAASTGSAGVPGASDEVAVDGAPTTAGTAANLLSYFPDGQLVTALVRIDRLRGTEWAAQTERLLRPMPDYQLLFGARDADITGKLETLVISTPRPRDAAATTLVARTELSRPALRDALGQGSPVTWSVARGGLLGRRTGTRFAGDERVFLSPFPGWFLLAQPGDLGGLTTPAPAPGKAGDKNRWTRGTDERNEAAGGGDPAGSAGGAGGRAPRGIDAAVATGALPPWLTGIRGIEREAGDARGPAVVVTVALGGKRLRFGAYALGLGVASIPEPDRISLAAELVPQGWLVRGNLRFATDTDAGEFVASIQHIQHSVADSRAIQLLLGKPIGRVIAALALARNGPRVSYATSLSIADARAILAATAQQIDGYFAGAAAPGRSAPPPGAPSPPPPPAPPPAAPH